MLRAGATVTAIIREISYASIMPPVRILANTFQLPPLGHIIIVLAYLAVLIVLSFYKLNPKDAGQWENIGYRTGFVSIAQLPLILLLAGKNNIVGFVAGSSYERLSWLHRWTARGLFVTTTIHLAYFLKSWARYDYILTKMREDAITQKGVAAWAILVWIVFSSMTPIRGWCYEFFVLQHLVSFAAFIGAVYIHTPKEAHVWIWIPVGLFFLDRLVRWMYMIFTNLAVFHPRTKSEALWACRAELTPLSHQTTRITIHNPPIGWTAGQHVFLSCHSIVPLQSHPFTIASIPSDKKMEFLVRAARGGTKRLFHYAEKNQGGLPTHETEGQMPTSRARVVAIEGPYGRMRPLPQFDSVVFLAGGSGATFTVPLMRDLVHRWLQTDAAIVTRRIRFVWVVKSRAQIFWFSEQLDRASEEVARLREASGTDVQIQMSVYVTCDASLTDSYEEDSVSSTRRVDDLSRGEVTCTSSTQSPSLDPMEQLGDKESVQEKRSEPTIAEEDEIQASSPRKSCCQPSVSMEKPTTLEADAASGTGCCCTRTITDEATMTNPCMCNCSSSDASSSASAPRTTSPPPSSSPLHASINLLSGRPSPRSIIKPALEQALGETAVVCCGPPGLEHDVRQTVVRLCDERAVCKGSGALAVWFWGERFGY